MKLLIITQSVDKNNPILGFFHRWIEEFSKNFDFVTVVCLEKGEYDLPKNIRVLSLGKESGKSRFKYVLNFYKYIWQERKNYDAVFVHMNPVYIILGGLFWKLWQKPVSLWYTHKNVDLKLHLAVLFLNTIFSASKESFRLKSKKLRVMGHGIDTNIFRPGIGYKEPYTILSVSRLAKTKNQAIMIESLRMVKKEGYNFVLILVGGPVTDLDKEFEKQLKEKVKKYELQDSVIFIGPIKPDTVAFYYNRANLFLNLSDTGSLDKAILEAMACGLQILTSNVAFKFILPEKNFTSNDPVEIARCIILLSKQDIDIKMREFVVDNHELIQLIGRMSLMIKKQ